MRNDEISGKKLVFCIIFIYKTKNMNGYQYRLYI